MKIRSKTFAVPALLASAMAFGGIMPAQAQTSNPQAQTSNPQTQERVKPQGQVSDSELQSFAVAALKVQDISNQWRPKIAGAQDAQQATELRKQATDEMIDAIQKEGLTVESYNSISAAARSDPELSGKIRTMMKETR